jgi:hypothetical protein
MPTRPQVSNSFSGSLYGLSNIAQGPSLRLRRLLLPGIIGSPIQSGVRSKRESVRSISRIPSARNTMWR